MANDTLAVTRIRRAAGLPLETWTDERIEAVRAMAAPGAQTVHELAMFLRTCQRYDLDPMQKEAWLGNLNNKPTVIVGRDAYIKIANRDPSFRGFQADVVRVQDKYSVDREGSQIVVSHKRTGFSRGAIVGAYALVRRDKREDVFVEIPWAELSHLHGRGPWKAHPSQMMLTRVLTFALKLAYNISGTLGEDDDGAVLPVDDGDGAQAERETVGRLAELKEALEGRPAETAQGNDVQDAVVVPGTGDEPEPEPIEQPAEKAPESSDHAKARSRYHAIWNELLREYNAAGAPLRIARADWQDEHLGKRSASHWSTDEYQKGAAMLTDRIGLPELPPVAPQGSGPQGQEDLEF